MSLAMQKASYTAHAIAVEVSKSAKKKTPQIVVTFAVPFEGQPDEEITWSGWLTDAALARTIESLDYMGWAGEDIAALHDCDAAAMLPHDVTIVVMPEEYDGTTTLKVAFVNRLGQGAARLGEAMADDEMRRFAASMKASIRNARGSASARSAPNPRNAQPQRAPERHPNAPDDLDDLPF